MNAGFYLYGANAMQYAADIGVATVAAEGNYSNPAVPAPNNADTVALSRMIAVGLNSTPLVTVTEVDVFKETVAAGCLLERDPTCGSDGNQLCENIYNASGLCPPERRGRKWRSTGIRAVRNVSRDSRTTRSS